MNAKRWITPAMPGENRLPARAYYVPYKDRDFSESRMRNLDGNWDFCYYETIPEVPENVSEITYGDTLPVPGCWQVFGYGQKQYTNVAYRRNMEATPSNIIYVRCAVSSTVNFLL